LRKNRTWANAALVALIPLMAASRSSAIPTTTGDLQTVQQTPAVESPLVQPDPSDEPVSITLQLQETDGGPYVPEPPAMTDGPDEGYDSDISSAVQSTTRKLRAIALCYLGTPYRWGGTTPRAFDCSGFTRYVYAKMGVKLPRTAREQYRVGMKVRSGAWRTGDLVFFDMRKGYVSHVGMYLAGRAFIHAANPRAGVRIDNLTEGSYKRCYVGARRYCT
jgi:cell wall-associated NlpC family hydrolase